MPELTPSQQALFDAAKSARNAAYAPYSKFKVGAAVRTASNRVFAGCNVENASYGLSMCAERVAVFNAVASGERNILQIALCTDAEEPSPPCGACRQVIAQFGNAAEVIMGNLQNDFVVRSLAELFPMPFEFKGNEPD